MTYDVYIGDTDFYGSYTSNNELCYSGGAEGLALCEGQGQYLIWRLKTKQQTGLNDVYFTEFFAYG